MIKELINFQSRIQIYKSSGFFLNFLKLIIFNFNNNKYELKIKKNINKIFNKKNIYFVSQCRQGIYYAVKYAIEKKGKKEVLISPYTLYHVINMIICAGGKPIFVDLKKDSFDICIKDFKKKITNETSCSIITHLNSISKDLHKIDLICREKDIITIEDCAVSFGSQYQNKIVGSISDIGIFSFNAMKNIQSLNGGLIVSSSAHFDFWIKREMKGLKTVSKINLFKMLTYFFIVDFLTSKKIINYIFFKIIKFSYKFNINFILKIIRADHCPKRTDVIPANYLKKLSNPQMAVLLKGFSNIENDQYLRYLNAIYYMKKLKNVSGLKFFYNNISANDIHLEFPIICNKREELFKYLLLNNIDCRKFYYRSLNKLDIYSEFHQNCPNSDFLESKILLLPCYPKFTRYNQDKIIFTIKEFYNKQI